MKYVQKEGVFRAGHRNVTGVFLEDTLAYRLPLGFPSEYVNFYV